MCVSDVKLWCILSPTCFLLVSDVSIHLGWEYLWSKQKIFCIVYWIIDLERFSICLPSSYCLDQDYEQGVVKIIFAKMNYMLVQIVYWKIFVYYMCFQHSAFSSFLISCGVKNDVWRSSRQTNLPCITFIRVKKIKKNVLWSLQNVDRGSLHFLQRKILSIRMESWDIELFHLLTSLFLGLTISLMCDENLVLRTKKMES